MYKLMIVDDESTVLNTIGALIDWTQYGVELISTCNNAIEAMKQVEEKHPNIIITDIKMPVVSGIEFIQQINQKGYSVQFIILSGYDEFDFAKDAMKEGVKHYLLKPCSEEEIITALQKVIVDIEKTNIISKDLQMGYKMKNIMENQIVSFGLHGFPIDYKMEHYFEEWFGEKDLLVWISFRDSGDINHWKNAVPCFNSFSNYAGIKMIFSVLKVNTAIGAIFSMTNEELLQINLTRLQKEISIVLGSIPEANRFITFPFYQLHEVLIQCCGNFIGYSVISENGIRYEKVGTIDYDKDLDKELVSIEKEVAEKSINLKKYLDKFLNTYDKSFLLMVSTKYLMKRVYFRELDEFQLVKILKEMYAAKNIEELTNYIIATFPELKGEKESIEYPSENFVNCIIHYIDENIYNPNISLKWCARELVFRNEDYVSKVFSRQTGTNFNNYLNEKRIEKAKFLISILGEDKICTVAEQVGFGHNPRYFSKLFKKYTGYTPKEYVKLNG